MIYLSPPSSLQKQHTMPMRTPWIGDFGSKILPSYSSLPFPLPKQVSVSARPVPSCPGCSGSPCTLRSVSLTFHAEGWLLCPTEGKVFIMAGLPLLHRLQTRQCPTVAEVVLSGRSGRGYSHPAEHTGKESKASS